MKCEMPLWNRELYGLRHQHRKAQRTFQNIPNEENIRVARAIKSSYQRIIRKAKWENWKGFCTEKFNIDPFGSLRKLSRYRNSMNNEISELQVDGNTPRRPLFSEPFLNLSPTQQNIEGKIAHFILRKKKLPYYFIDIKEEELSSVFHSFSSNKAPGPDCIQALVLQENFIIFMSHLFIIFNACVKTNYIPKA